MEVQLPVHVVERQLRRAAKRAGASAVSEKAAVAMANAVASLIPRLVDAAAAALDEGGGGEGAGVPSKRARRDGDADAGAGASAEAEAGAGAGLASVAEAEAGAGAGAGEAEGGIRRPRIGPAHAAEATRTTLARAPARAVARWFIVDTEGAGSCLFISLVLAHRLREALRQAARFVRVGGARPPAPQLDGYAEAAVKEAAIVRTSIVDWFHRGIDNPLPGGEYLHRRADSRRLTRGDLIASYAVGDAVSAVSIPETTAQQAREAADAAVAAVAVAAATGQTQPREDAIAEIARVAGEEPGTVEDRAAVAAEFQRKLDGGALTAAAAIAAARADRARADVGKRTEALAQYLLKMTQAWCWGSLPEWQAWAYMMRTAVVAYVPCRADPLCGVQPEAAVVPPVEGAVTKLAAPVPEDVLAFATGTKPETDAAQQGSEEEHEHEHGDATPDAARADSAEEDEPFDSESEEEEGEREEEEGESEEESLADIDPYDCPQEDEMPFAIRLLLRKNHYCLMAQLHEVRLLAEVHGEEFVNRWFVSLVAYNLGLIRKGG